MRVSICDIYSGFPNARPAAVPEWRVMPDSSAGRTQWRGANCSAKVCHQPFTRLSPPRRPSEGIPGRLVGIFEIAEIGPEPCPDAGADRRQLQLLVGLEIDPEPANQIGGAFDAHEMVEDLRRCLDVVDEDERSRSVAADVEADRGSLPINLLLPAIRQVERALAIAQAPDKGRRSLLADDVAA